MADTKQTRAIAAANEIESIAGILASLRTHINSFVTRYNSEGYSTTWNNLPTSAQNADGSLGASDASPVTTHPINLTTLAKSVSAGQLIAGVTMIEQLQNFFTGAAVTTGVYNQTIDDLAS